MNFLKLRAVGITKLSGTVSETLGAHAAQIAVSAVCKSFGQVKSNAVTVAEMKWTFRSQVTGLEDFVFDLNKIQGIREYEDILEEALLIFIFDCGCREAMNQSLFSAMKFIRDHSTEKYAC
jgi:hypothetical protein